MDHPQHGLTGCRIPRAGIFTHIEVRHRIDHGNRGFTINFRVDDLQEFLDQLNQKGVEMEGDILEWERGKHAWVKDPDGNLIELYEEIFVD